MALRAVPSLKSLSQLVHLNVSTWPAPLQTYAQESLNAYVQPQNLTVVQAALATKDRVLVLKTLQILNYNLSRLSQGDSSTITDSRQRRDTAVATLVMAQYRSLVPMLAIFTKDLQDSELLQLAQQITSYIQSANNVAVN